MREQIIEDFLVREVKRRGGFVRKVKWIGRRGAQDRLVLLPGVSIWIELKAPGKKAEPHQAREHERMRRLGQRVEVVDSKERVLEILG